MTHFRLIYKTVMCARETQNKRKGERREGVKGEKGREGNCEGINEKVKM